MTYQIKSLKSFAKVEQPDGIRVSRIIAKSVEVVKGQPKKKVIGKREMESQGVAIPQVHVSLLNAMIDNQVGREYLRNTVESVQDALIRRAVENGKMAIFDDAIGFDAMIAFMSEVNESVRFSKESIKVWFDEYLADALEIAIRDKMPAIADSQVSRLVSNYLESFQVLAGRTPSMPSEVKAGLIRALEFLPEDHDTVTGNEVASRLSVVQEASVILAAL